jgi:hypothetical protein
VFDLDTNEKKVDLADDDVFQVIPARRSEAGHQLHKTFGRPNKPTGDALCFIILKLDMQTIFYPDLHLDRHIRIWWHPVRMDPDFAFFDDIAHPTGDGDAEKVPATARQGRRRGQCSRVKTT